MLPATMSNSTSLSEEASISSCTRIQDFSSLNPIFSALSPHQQQKIKKKRSLPGNPDPDAEVIALSPKALLATNKFVCDICNKGFQRDQNLQLHRRGHNLPWKLRQRTSSEIRKRVYVCPEPSCVHHNPSRALGDLTGIKKHFCRKHGEKKWKCDKCSKIYAVQSDWKAHSKTCGTREYRCDCGTHFSRKDSFITHRAFCDALAEESARISTNQFTTTNPNDPENTPLFFPFSSHQQGLPSSPTHISLTSCSWYPLQNPNSTSNPIQIKLETDHQIPDISLFFQETHHKQLITPPFLQQHPNMTSNPNRVHMSATALLQKAAHVGVAAITGPTQARSVGHMASSMTRLEMGKDGTMSQMGTGISPGYLGFHSKNTATWQKSDHLTRDFLGLSEECAVDFPKYDGGHSMLRPTGFGFADPAASEAWGGC